MLTDRIRVLVNAGLYHNSRIVEVEAWTAAQTLPVVAIAAPVAGASVAQFTTVPITANAPETGILRVEFLVDGALIGSDFDAPYTIAWNAATQGSHVLSARAIEGGGGSVNSAPVQINVGAPANTPPWVAINSAGTHFPAPATIALSATASDADGSITLVEFLANGNVIGSSTTAPYEFSWNAVPAGSYTLTARATDNVGASSVSTPAYVTVGSGTGSRSVYYIHSDQLGTPRLVTDTANRERWRWDAEPFGSTPANGNPAGLGSFEFSLRFPGQYFDAESGMHYNYFRDYDPSTGRYVQSDPIGLAGGINTYSYVGGNPLGLTDPFGLYKYNAPAPRTVPVEGETESSLSCLEQCLRVTTRSPKLELLVTGGAETKGHSKKSRHYTGEACDIAPLKATNDQVNDCASRCGFRGGQFETFPDNPRRNHYHFQQEPGNGVPRLTPFTPDP